MSTGVGLGVGGRFALQFNRLGKPGTANNPLLKAFVTLTKPIKIPGLLAANLETTTQVTFRCKGGAQVADIQAKLGQQRNGILPGM